MTCANNYSHIIFICLLFKMIERTMKQMSINMNKKKRGFEFIEQQNS